jgi:hypothetical protein
LPHGAARPAPACRARRGSANGPRPSSAAARAPPISRKCCARARLASAPPMFCSVQSWSFNTTVS